MVDTEPSIEMVEDLKEPGDGDSGTEINTSGGGGGSGVDGGVQPVKPENQHEKTPAVEADLSIQETETTATSESAFSSSAEQETHQHETVASGCESGPVENAISSGLSNREIPQENIKHALHEIISEIDREMEADFSNEEVSLGAILVSVSVGLFLVRSVSI